MPLLSRSAPEHSRPALDPIRIATDDIELVGSVAPTGQRITDLLLRGQDLAFLPRGAEPAPEAWIRVAPSDVLWVVPPPLRDRGRASPSPAHGRIFVRVGGYRIIGSAHVTPDAAADPRLAARQTFLPLTAASIAREGREAASGVEDVDVVIVNLARAEEQRAIG